MTTARKAARFAVTALAAGVILWRADVYFWTTPLDNVPSGGFAIRMLATLLAVGMTLDFLAGIRILRLPRREDVLFVAGADFEARKKRVLEGIAASAARWPALPGAAYLAVAALEGLPLAAVVKSLGLLLAETLILSSVFLALVKFGWIRPSRKGYLGRSGGSGGRPAGSLSLRATAAGVRPITRGLPSPYRWLTARLLLAAARREPVSAVLYGAFLIALGAQFLIWGSLAPLIVFTLVACMLTMTLFRTLTDPSRAYAESCAWLFPPAWIRHRCEAALMLSFSGIFLAYFLVAARHHLGSAAAWQCAATLVAFALLQAADGPGRQARPEARMVLNFGYLGLAGALFMFPFWGLAIALAAGLVAAAVAFRHGLPPHRPSAAAPGR